MTAAVSRQGAADLAMLQAVFSHQPGAWAVFVRQCQGDILAACRLAFPGREADQMFVEVIGQLREHEFALLREFDGRAPLAAYLRLVLRDLLSQRVARLLADSPERGWRTFEHFFKRDMLRIIGRTFPSLEAGDDDIYHDIATALIEDGYRRILAYDGQGSFGGFVLRVVNNLCIDRLRKDVPRRRLPAAIQRLGDVEQEIFRQLYWEDCPPERLPAVLHGKNLALDEAVFAAALAKVRGVVPRDHGIDEAARPRLVALPGASEAEPGSEPELADDRPNPEEATIAVEDETMLAAASGALRAAIAKLPNDIRLYLQHVMATNGELPAREIARLMARPVSEIYRLKQQAERQLRQALTDHPAVKNLRMSV